MKYEDWTQSVSEDALKCALSKAQDLMKSSELSNYDLDALHHCVEIIYTTRSILDEASTSVAH